MVKNIILAMALVMMICGLGGRLAVQPESNDDFDELQDKYHYDEYEKLYFSMISNADEPGTPGFMAQPEAQRALFVVLIFDMEIQNGGIAQYFWNTGSDYARLTSESLRTAGFDDVADLYERFVTENAITLSEIDSYRERFPADENWADLYDFHPFEDFDNAYIKIWEETDFNQRLLDYAAQHPEVYFKE